MGIGEMVSEKVKKEVVELLNFRRAARRSA